jgi:hypothetical protein
VDKNPFLFNIIDLQNSKVLIRLEQATVAKGKNVVISEKRTITTDEKVLSREVVVEKTANGKETLKITDKSPTLGVQAQAKIVKEMAKQPEAPQPVRPAHATSQTGSARGCPAPPVRLVPHTSHIGPRAPGRQRTFKPKSLEKGR